MYCRSLFAGSPSTGKRRSPGRMVTGGAHDVEKTNLRNGAERYSPTTMARLTTVPSCTSRSR